MSWMNLLIHDSKVVLSYCWGWCKKYSWLYSDKLVSRQTVLLQGRNSNLSLDKIGLFSTMEDLWMSSHKLPAIYSYVWFSLLNKNGPNVSVFMLITGDVNIEVLPSKTLIKLLGNSFNTAMCFHMQTFLESTLSRSPKVFSLLRAA